MIIKLLQEWEMNVKMISLVSKTQIPTFSLNFPNPKELHVRSHIKIQPLLIENDEKKHRTKKNPANLMPLQYWELLLRLHGRPVVYNPISVLSHKQKLFVKIMIQRRGFISHLPKPITYVFLNMREIIVCSFIECLLVLYSSFYSWKIFCSSKLEVLQFNDSSEIFLL